MANFIPIKNYMFFCLDRFIEMYGLTHPFLDVGCGVGDLSAYLGKKNWRGKAIDSSDTAIAKASDNLKSFPGIVTENKSLMEEIGHYKTVLLWDVLEHIEDDRSALKKIAGLVSLGGHLVLAVPSNHEEWRWDDEFYGHYRHYTKKEISDKLQEVGLRPVVFWDFTFPFFWVMRRIYTYFKKPTEQHSIKIEKRTAVSSLVNAWDVPVISNMANNSNFIWKLVYHIQYRFFKNCVSKGYEMLVLAKKSE